MKTMSVCVNVIRMNSYQQMKWEQKWMKLNEQAWRFNFIGCGAENSLPQAQLK